MLGGIESTSVAERKWLEGSGGRSIGQLIELEDTYRFDSIVIAIENALLAKTEVNATERVVLTVEAMEREVNNGGFQQFFLNSSNEFAPVLVAALQQIGASKTAGIADRAARAIGATSDWPSERYERAASEADEDTLRELSACDESYYASGEAIADMLFEFIKVNQANIDPNADAA
jgi:hypothetical protein